MFITISLAGGAGSEGRIENALIEKACLDCSN